MTNLPVAPPIGERGNEALKIVKLVILITDTLSLNVVISLAGEFEGPVLNRRRRAIIFRSGGVVLLEGRVSRTPNDPVLQGQRAGPLAGGACSTNDAHFMQGFPPQLLFGVDRLRCKWLNLKFAAPHG
jgi:hypothetical protein